MGKTFQRNTHTYTKKLAQLPTISHFQSPNSPKVESKNIDIIEMMEEEFVFLLLKIINVCIEDFYEKIDNYAL